jgi:hypothetical protein
LFLVVCVLQIEYLDDDEVQLDEEDDLEDLDEADDEGEVRRAVQAVGAAGRRLVTRAAGR